MKLIQFGLFQSIYWRFGTVIAVTLVAMLVFSHFHQSRALIYARQHDLQQEADWFARHAGGTDNYEQIAAAWRSMHDNVQLQIISPSGEVIADSFSEQPVPNGQGGITISARSSIVGQDNVLILTRGGMHLYPSGMQFGLALTALLLLLMAGMLLYPLTRHLVRTFEKLSALAARVSGGEYGKTLQVKGDRDLTSLVDSFNAMSIRLRDGEEQNRQLLIDVSHEFRSPLGRITALVETLERHPAEMPELCHQIQSELTLLDMLTGDALSAAKLSPPKENLKFQPVEMKSWLDAAFGRLGEPARRNGLHVQCKNNIAKVVLEIDPDRLMQALGNLVDNACKAVSASRDGKLTFIAYQDANTVFIEIKDNGNGILDEHMPHIFDRYYQADSNGKGLGLGLGVARTLIEANGGQLRLASTEADGTTAGISLPISHS